jgi:hypothetical protein
MSNMKLWDSVQESDPAYVKEVKVGAYKFNAIDAYSQIKAATGHWGPYGATWGFGEALTITILEDAKLAIGQATFFYPDGNFTVTSSIDYVSAKGRVDSEFAKKLETDMITKALSRLGFNADVFLGWFDDSRYVQGLREKMAAPPQEYADIINNLLLAAGNGNSEEFQSQWRDLSTEEQQALWPHFSSEQRAHFKSLLGEKDG